ncbi:MAG: GNAT family N-acetyltransferase [Gracilibacteraceae bacterium]|nr:GNAT family N-acetyltransferase [Gracilibacteraceae bacterium]
MSDGALSPRREAFANIRLSRRRDIPFLRRIYRLSFGDGLASENLLFRELYREDNCYVFTRFGLPAAMAFALPATIRSCGREWRGLYLYAVATHPRRRRKGYSSRLLEWIHADAAARGLDFALLVPASPDLYEFYARLGYEKVGRICRYDYMPPPPTAAAGVPLRLTPVSGELYGRARELLLRDSSYLVWQSELLAYQSKMLALFGGGFCLLQEGGRDIGCAAVSRHSGGLEVQEILVPPEWLQSALTALAGHYGVQRLRARLPVERGLALGLRGLDLAMVYAPQAAWRELYVALVMD